MRPDIYEFITETRAIFTDRLNTFLESKGLEAVTILDSGLKILKKAKSLAVYPTSGSGSTTEESASSATFRFTVDFFCNRNGTEGGMEEVERYYSALFAFLASNCFGEYSFVSDSVLIRMDENEAFNGCSFLVESRITTYMDFADYL